MCSGPAVRKQARASLYTLDQSFRFFGYFKNRSAKHASRAQEIARISLRKVSFYVNDLAEIAKIVATYSLNY